LSLRLRADANLVAYVFLTVLGLMAVVDWLAPLPAAGDGCRVGYVYDGDSVEMICDGVRETARVLGIDTPELEGRCAAEVAAAQAAKTALAGRVSAAREVRIEVRGRDKYHRPLIRLWLDGQDAAAAMIAAGQGRAYDGGHRAGWCG
jgi:micrococcal nuclease